MDEKIFNPLSVNLLGMTGKAGSGKDTAAGFLSEEFGLPMYALAGPLKKSINDIFGWDERHGWGELKEAQVTFKTYKGWKFKVVDILRENLGQYLSDLDRYQTLELFFEKVLPNDASKLRTEESVKITTSPRKIYQLFGTEFGRHLDGELWLKLAELELEDKGCLIVTDVRFENEANFIRNNGGRIIHIERNDAVKVNQHVSEAGIAKVNKDITIVNKGSLDDFKNLVLDNAYLI